MVGREVIKIRRKTCTRCGCRFETKGRYCAICDKCDKRYKQRRPRICDI